MRWNLHALSETRRVTSPALFAQSVNLMKYDGGAISQWAGDSQWRACRADLTRYRLQGYTGWGSEGFWALAIYRLQKVVRQFRPRWLWAPARLTLRVVKKLLSIVTLIDLHPDAEIGPA